MLYTIRDERSPVYVEVKTLLSAMINSRTPAGRLQRATRLLGIFRRYPSLAYRTYAMDNHVVEYTPLLIWIREGVNNIDAIRDLCDICGDHLPSVLQPWGSSDESPFVMACKKSSVEVVNYFLSKVGDDTRCYFTTFGLALSNEKLSAATLQKLLKLCPKAWNKDSESLFSKILKRSPPIDFLKFVAKIWPKTVTHLSIHDSIQILNLEIAKVVCKILPKLQSITIQLEWSPEAFLLFLQHLATNQSITEIGLLKIPQIEEPLLRQDILRKFPLFMESNSPLKKIGRVTLKVQHIKIVEEWLSEMDNGMAINQSLLLESLDFTVDGGHEAKVRVWRKSCPSQLLGITVTGFQEPKPGFLDFLQFLAKLRCVQSLSVVGSGRVPLSPEAFTERITFLLKQDHSFQELSLDCEHELDMHPVCEVLRTNRRLTKFSCFSSVTPESQTMFLSMLQNHGNTTLTSLSPWRSDEQIKMYLDLNRFGRAVITGECVSGGSKNSTVVDLLSNVNQSNLFDTHRNGDLRKFNVLYGLLRELPASWCSQSDVATATDGLSVNRNATDLEPTAASQNLKRKVPVDESDQAVPSKKAAPSCG